MARIIASDTVDKDVERRLVHGIIRAICKASLADVPMIGDVMAIRTMETAQALITVLAMVLAISPKATRSPSEMRHYGEEVHKQLVRLAKTASNEENLQIFLRLAQRDEGSA